MKGNDVMKNTNRVLALMLASLLVCASAVSCANEEKPKEKAPVNTDIVLDEGPKLEVPAGIAADKTFSIYIAHSSVNSNYIAEEENGNDINDAVYQRNALVEEHTGVTLEFTGSTRPTDGGSQQAETAHVRTLIQAGDTTYDAYVNVQHSGMPTLIEEGMFVDWNDIPHINLENPWWYSNVQRDICFGNKIFCMTGSMSVGINILKSDEKELEEITSYISDFKTIRHITQNAYLYRLSSAFENNYTVWEYLARDRKNAVIFIFASGMNFKELVPFVKLRGLDKDKAYKVYGEDETKPESFRIVHGDALMDFGLYITPRGDYYAHKIRIEEI